MYKIYIRKGWDVIGQVFDHWMQETEHPSPIYSMKKKKNTAFTNKWLGIYCFKPWSNYHISQISVTIHVHS